MLYDSANELFFNLAHTLVGNQAEQGAIVKALELICDGTNLECGAAYETDMSGNFCLLARYASASVVFPETLNAEKLSLEAQTFIERTPVFHIKKKSENTDMELRLLDLFATESAVMAPILDEGNGLYGLILLFIPTVSTAVHADSDIRIVSAALSQLVRYTGMRMYQQKLAQTHITMESILDNTGIDIYVNDFYTHDILYVNKSMAMPYGGQKQFIGKKCWQVLFPGQSGPCEFCPQHKIVDSEGNPTGKVYTWDYQRAFDGSWFRVFSAAFQWVDGRLAHVVSSADITDNKRNEALIDNMAHYDQLTKLPNRRMLMKECERCINKATAAERGYVLFFDIDGFKAINDQLGHDAGDEFLIQLGEFFSSIPLLTNSIYRNGGDEFVAVIGGEAITKDHIRSLANFIHERFKKTWVLKKGEILCNTSIGVACYPEDGVTVDVLLQKADMAMYHVKKSGGGSICFGYELKESLPSDNE